MSAGSVNRYMRLVLLLSAGLIGVLAATVGVTTASAPACIACHRSSGDLVRLTQEGPHASVDCRSCHVPADVGGRVGFASRQVFTMALRLPSSGDRALAYVPDERCVGCHESALAGTVSSNGINFRHESCAQGRRCTDCHSATTHGTATGWVRVAEMSDCLACHTTKRVAEDCGLCHAKREKRERLVIGEWATTHGAQWTTTHGMGNLQTCAACHDDEYCVRCHGVALPHPDEYVLSHSDEAVANRAKCQSCHDLKLCDSCHGVPMPHEQGFVRRHAAQVERDGDSVCKRCHEDADCTECHVRHVHPIDLQQIPGQGRS